MTNTKTKKILFVVCSIMILATIFVVDDSSFPALRQPTKVKDYDAFLGYLITHPEVSNKLPIYQYPKEELMLINSLYKTHGEFYKG